MRALLLLVALAVGCGAAVPAARAGGLRGAGGGRRWGSDAARVVPAASTLKTLLLLAHLRRGDLRGRPLRAADRALLAP